MATLPTAKMLFGVHRATRQPSIWSVPNWRGLRTRRQDAEQRLAAAAAGGGQPAEPEVIPLGPPGGAAHSQARATADGNGAAAEPSQPAPEAGEWRDTSAAKLLDKWMAGSPVGETVRDLLHALDPPPHPGAAQRADAPLEPEAGAHPNAAQHAAGAAEQQTGARLQEGETQPVFDAALREHAALPQREERAAAHWKQAMMQHKKAWRPEEWWRDARKRAHADEQRGLAGRQPEEASERSATAAFSHNDAFELQPDATQPHADDAQQMTTDAAQGYAAVSPVDGGDTAPLEAATEPSPPPFMAEAIDRRLRALESRFAVMEQAASAAVAPTREDASLKEDVQLLEAVVDDLTERLEEMEKWDEGSDDGESDGASVAEQHEALEERVRSLEASYGYYGKHAWRHSVAAEGEAADELEALKERVGKLEAEHSLRGASAAAAASIQPLDPSHAASGDEDEESDDESYDAQLADLQEQVTSMEERLESLDADDIHFKNSIHGAPVSVWSHLTDVTIQLAAIRDTYDNQLGSIRSDLDRLGDTSREQMNTWRGWKSAGRDQWTDADTKIKALESSVQALQARLEQPQTAAARPVDVRNPPGRDASPAPEDSDQGINFDMAASALLVDVDRVQFKLSAARAGLAAGNFGGVGGTAKPDGMAAGLDVAQEKIDGIRAHLCEARTLRREAGPAAALDYLRSEDGRHKVARLRGQLDQALRGDGSWAALGCGWLLCSRAPHLRP